MAQGVEPTILPVGAFLHSFGEYDIARNNMIEAIETAMKVVNLIQLGPVSDVYLTGEQVESKREELVDMLGDRAMMVGPLCVCYESGKGRGGIETYDDIEAIARTGGYGYQGKHKRRILAERLELTKDHIDLARHLQASGVMSPDRAILTTHAGFFDRAKLREQIREAVMDIVGYCDDTDTYFAIETGSERMQELIAFIKGIEHETDIRGRLGVNYDPANFLLYGTQDPLEALDFLKNENNREYLFGVHVKNAIWDINPATNPSGKAKGKWKGREIPIGVDLQGRSVDFVGVINRLYQLGYRGLLIIEREGQYQGVADRTQARISDIAAAVTNIMNIQMYILQDVRPDRPFGA